MIEVYSEKINAIWFGVACAQQKIFATAFGGTQQKVLANLIESLPFDMPFQVFLEPSDFAHTVLSSLSQIYEGKDPQANFSLITEHLPAFTRRVLEATMQIPIGYVASYGAIAKAVGGGARAVGNVMANNPFAPIVPCHRVVKSDFGLGGYGGGLNVKVQLLSREKHGFGSSKEVEIEGKSVVVFPVEYVLRLNL